MEAHPNLYGDSTSLIYLVWEGFKQIVDIIFCLASNLLGNSSFKLMAPQTYFSLTLKVVKFPPF